MAILMKSRAEPYLARADAAFLSRTIALTFRVKALKRVIANANFTGQPFDIDLIKDSLKDLLALQDRPVSLDNIKQVAEYYKIKVADLMSKSAIARWRGQDRWRWRWQKLTHHSLPEIGDAFGI